MERKVIQYFDGCPKGALCLFCHGWKELEFHKNNFKVKKCSFEECSREKFCPYIHEGEIYESEEEEQNRLYKALSLQNSIGSQSTKNFSFS